MRRNSLRPPIQPLSYTVEEAAASIPIGLVKAYELIHSGEWPSYHLPGRNGEPGDIRVPVEELRRWVQARTTGGIAPDHAATHVATQQKTSEGARRQAKAKRG